MNLTEGNKLIRVTVVERSVARDDHPCYCSLPPYKIPAGKLVTK